MKARFSGLPARIAARAILISLVMIPVAVSRADAYFEESDIGARSIGFAKAFTAIADDATAIYWNPAALTRLEKSQAVLVYSRPYSVSGLSSNYAAVVLPMKSLALGVSWHHFGAADVISEDTFSLAAGREIFATDHGLRLSLGGALKIARVSFPSYPDPVTLETVDFGSATHPTADLAVMAVFPNRITIGYDLQNLGEPEFDVIEGGGGTELSTRSRIGAAYHWNAESTVTVEYQEIADGKAILNLGGEIWFYRAFAIRAGISDVNAGGGVSIRSSRWLFDLAFLTNGPLGASYRAGLTVPFKR